MCKHACTDNWWVGGALLQHKHIWYNFISIYKPARPSSIPNHSRALLAAILSLLAASGIFVALNRRVYIASASWYLKLTALKTTHSSYTSTQSSRLRSAKVKLAKVKPMYVMAHMISGDAQANQQTNRCGNVIIITTCNGNLSQSIVCVATIVAALTVSWFAGQCGQNPGTCSLMGLNVPLWDLVSMCPHPHMSTQSTVVKYKVTANTKILA